jgi:hypothetical protein
MVVVVVVVELVVDDGLVVAVAVVVGSEEVEGVLVEVVVAGVVVIAVVDGDEREIVVVADPAAASLQAETSNKTASAAIGNVLLRPAMRGDHMDDWAVRLITDWPLVTRVVRLGTDRESASRATLGSSLARTIGSCDSWSFTSPYATSALISSASC